MGVSEKSSINSIEDNNVSIPPEDRAKILVCAIRGRITALSKVDGSVFWETKFPYRRAKGDITAMAITDSDTVIAGSMGATVFLDLFNGSIKWKNNMEGFGYEIVSVTCNATRSSVTPVSENEGLPQYSSSASVETPIVFSASFGKVMAMHGDTGESMWVYDCPDSGHSLPVLLTEPPAAGSAHASLVLYVGSKNFVYCLLAHTGEVIWKKKIQNTLMERLGGYNYITMVSPISPKLAVEVHNTFNPRTVY
ncbi:hypothetical protein BDB01DRAFT_767701 [Pilobolus umbonatus]|nr:hypothetical protein BDB01DRAFT_767701 [Pilobolus umbonatus]